MHGIIESRQASERLVYLVLVLLELMVQGGYGKRVVQNFLLQDLYRIIENSDKTSLSCQALNLLEVIAQRDN